MDRIAFKPQIYLVDDDEAVRKALSRLLKAAGYAWEAFASAEDFLAALPAEDGILLLDLRMPGIDGFTLQRKLQTLRPQLPVVFITGHAQPGDRERALAAGAKGFLTKPFDGETLLKMIEAIIKTKRKEG
ncbi:MAG: response regulator [Clostridia bacterium]|jgi:FixJ family two-component response regulator|nr:response regulator [Clostridia bacterium]